MAHYGQVHDPTVCLASESTSEFELVIVRLVIWAKMLECQGEQSLFCWLFTFQYSCFRTYHAMAAKASQEMTLKKIGAPDKTSDQDQAKVLKTSQRVAANMVKYGECDEPLAIDPDELGADMMNRAGAVPNISVCRENIGQSFKAHGFDKNRPMPGIAKDYSKNPQKLEALIQHNLKMSEGDPRWPPVLTKKMSKGTLASTHLNIAIRLHKHGVMSPTGEPFSIAPDDPNLLRVTQHGHKWWLLSCDIPDAAAIEISEWRNSDNNNNQVKHEIEHIRGLQRVARKEFEVAGSAGIVSLANVVAKFTAQAQLKMVQTTTLDLARFVVDFRAVVHIDNICTHHSQHVNPNELTVPPALFSEITKQIKKSASKLKEALIIEAYTPEGAIKKARPLPDVADFIKTSDVKALSCREADIDATEDFFKHSTTKYEPMLRSFMDARKVSSTLRMLRGTVVRVALNKAMRPEFQPKVKNGQITAEKLEVITASWRKYVEAKEAPSPQSAWEFLEEQDIDADFVAVPEEDGDDIIEGEAKDMVEKGFLIGKMVQIKKRVLVTCLELDLVFHNLVLFLVPLVPKPPKASKCGYKRK